MPPEAELPLPTLLAPASQTACYSRWLKVSVALRFTLAYPWADEAWRERRPGRRHGAGLPPWHRPRRGRRQGLLDDGFIGKIQRANLDGSGVQDVLTALKVPVAIALDLTAPHGVGGLAHGFPPTKVVCKNITTGQRVKITLAPGSLSWDCAAAGLVVQPGDSLKMTVSGSE